MTINYCAKCKTNTSGYILNMNGKSEHKCVECKTGTEIIKKPTKHVTGIIFRSGFDGGSTENRVW